MRKFYCIFFAILILLLSCKNSTFSHSSETNDSAYYHYNNDDNTGFYVNNDVFSSDEYNNDDHESIGFIFPAPTNDLILYSSVEESTVFQLAVDIFSSLYPDIRIEWHKLSSDEFETQVRTEIPAGRGPDVLLGYSSLLPDIYKTMSTGIFTDLAPYMSNDPEYDPADYYEGVMRGGQMYGKQYVLPLSFGINAFMTSKELLEKNGIDPDGMHAPVGMFGFNRQGDCGKTCGSGTDPGGQCPFR